ncbi:glycosylated lysosomal membrane protein [Pholidichthys leucotaenia]
MADNRMTMIVGVLALCVLTTTRGTGPDRRQLSMHLIPNTSSVPHDGDLLHVRAVGNNDTLHFLFCSLGAPTLLLVHTDTPNSTVEVNWTDFVARNSSSSLKVEPESSVQYSGAVVFSRLIEYDDVNDTATPTSDVFPPYNLHDFIWAPLNLSDFTALLCGAAPTFTNGSLCLKLSAFESEGRGQSLPHLLHSVNSSQLDVWLDGVLPRAPQSRFLLELQAVGGAYPLSRVNVRQSIDDEFTPSIFKVSEWVSSSNGSSDVLGFLQWKPVAYRKPCPILEDATPVCHSGPHPQMAVGNSSTLILGFFSAPQTIGLNLSFGLAGEQFYNKTRYLMWTMLMGVGPPPVDSFSSLVIGIMAVGLGIPIVLLLVGGVAVCVHKRRKAAVVSYQPIN